MGKKEDDGHGGIRSFARKDRQIDRVNVKFAGAQELVTKLNGM